MEHLVKACLLSCPDIMFQIDIHILLLSFGMQIMDNEIPKTYRGNMNDLGLFSASTLLNHDPVALDLSVEP